MDEVERYRHQLHAQLPAFGRKVDWTHAIIDDALAVGRFYCSWSGGIDSTVMLHMILQHTGVDIRWVDDGWDFPETITFLCEMEEHYGFHLARMRSLHNWREWCEEMGRPDLADDPQALEVWGNPHEWDGGWKTHEEWLETLQPMGYGGAFIGMLAGESKSRHYQLQGGRRTLYQVKREHGFWHCCPLAHWSKADVWAYAIMNNLSYNPVYDTLASLDIPLERRRVGPLVCMRVMQYGSVARLKQGWPGLFNKLAALFPRVREYS